MRAVQGAGTKENAREKAAYGCKSSNQKCKNKMQVLITRGGIGLPDRLILLFLFGQLIGKILIENPRDPRPRPRISTGILAYLGR